MGRRSRPKQRSIFIPATALASGPRNRFYESLEKLLQESRLDEFAEKTCAGFYMAGGPGRPSLAPGVYFRMLMIGYFEGIESERGICWRCADSLSLKRFLGFDAHEQTPDHSTLSVMRTRLDVDAYHRVFDFVLKIVDDAGLLKGKVAGVDATYLRADAAMKSIVRRDTDEDYQAYLLRLAKESGISAPTAEDARRLDRKRKGKKTSNSDWRSPTDPDSRIVKMKDGTTRLAHKAEHAVDLESGAIVEPRILEATMADSASLTDTLSAAEERIQAARAADDDTHDDTDPPQGSASGNADGTSKEQAIKEAVADKGYHKATTIAELKAAGIRSYIPEPKQSGIRHWKDKGGWPTARAVYDNRLRVGRAKGKRLQRKRGELIERTFAHICETGGHRRVRLRGRENILKRYLVQVAAFNLGIVLRAQLGRGTPRGLADAQRASIAAIIAVISILAALTRMGRRILTIGCHQKTSAAHHSVSSPFRHYPIFSPGC